MIALYVESSAVLDAVFGTDPTVVEVLHDPHMLVFTSELTYVEVERAFVRGLHSGQLSARTVQEARARLDEFRPRWTAMQLTEKRLARAGQPFPVEPVRGLDGLHLATLLSRSKT